MKPNILEMEIQPHPTEAGNHSPKARTCSICNETDLIVTERNGVEIDYCPKCSGVWLDRGELDKIIERSIPSSSEQSIAPAYRYWGINE